MNGNGPHVKTWMSFGSGMSVKSMKPWRERVSPSSTVSYQRIGSEVVDLSSEMQNGFTQGVILSPAIGVGHDHGSLGLGSSDLFHDGQHRCDARARTRQQDRRLGGRQDEIASRGAHIEHISDLHVIMQMARNPAVGC